VEASTLHPAASLTRPRVAIGGPLLRLRSDEQLVELFRTGSEEAFRAIHDRYQKRLFAYARQMLPARQDAEDALQDVFVRAYSGLRSSDRELALRAWLFRIAHNRCIDELRKPSPPPPEVLQLVRSTVHDPLVEVDLRESLRRLVEDIRRLPEQQRSALLMRELGGMSYAELSASLGISVGAVKSLLVRARLALAEAAEARDTACAVIREQLIEAHDHGVRPNANARKHMRDCVGCKSFRRELRGVSRQLAAIAPTLGPLGLLANLLGFSGGAGGGAAGGAGGGAAFFGGSGATASAGGLALGANHVATLIVAAVATAGGAVEIQRTFLPPSHPATVREAPIRGTHRSDAAALPQRAARDIETRALPGTTAVTPVARTKTGATAAVSGTSALAKATVRHTAHGPGTVKLTRDIAKRSAGAVINGNDLPSPSIIPSSPTSVTPPTVGTQVTASCPATGTLGVAGAQSTTSGTAPASATASTSTPPSSATSSTASTTPAACSPSTGSTVTATPPGDSSTTGSSTTSPTTSGSASTGTGSSSVAAAAAGSSSDTSTSSSNPATSTR
jgi:RNA polymerase sigma factor (sigma-70 family)